MKWESSKRIGLRAYYIVETQGYNSRSPKVGKDFHSGSKWPKPQRKVDPSQSTEYRTIGETREMCDSERVGNDLTLAISRSLAGASCSPILQLCSSIDFTAGGLSYEVSG